MLLLEKKGARGSQQIQRQGNWGRTKATQDGHSNGERRGPSESSSWPGLLVPGSAAAGFEQQTAVEEATAKAFPQYVCSDLALGWSAARTAAEDGCRNRRQRSDHRTQVLLSHPTPNTAKLHVLRLLTMRHCQSYLTQLRLWHRHGLRQQPALPGGAAPAVPSWPVPCQSRSRRQGTTEVCDRLPAGSQL